MATETPAVDVATFADGLTDKVLHCRELGHVWRAHTVNWDSDARAYDRRLLCTSCRTVRVQLLSEHGHIVSNRYIYADGYLATGVQIGRGERDTFRRVALLRFLGKQQQLSVAV